MKKILNEWRRFLKEGNEILEILDKVRDIFFGAYNSWEKEYKLLHSDKKFHQYIEQLEQICFNPHFLQIKHGA